MLPAAASAATYQDVTNSLVANPAPSGCVNWVEEVGSGYKVWRRCATGTAVEITGIDSFSGSGALNSPMSVYLCNYTLGTFTASIGTTAYGGSFCKPYTQSVSCLGTNTITRGNNITCYNAPAYSKDPCPLQLTTVTNCRSYDTLLVEFIPIDQCLNKLTNIYESCFQNCKDPVDKAGTTITEICGDGIDNDCDGQVDEGCEPEEVKKNLGSGSDKTNPATECGFSTANFSTGNLYKDYTIPLGSPIGLSPNVSIGENVRGQVFRPYPLLQQP
ncbi:MAG: putative metal-binding motif-containing protein [Deltaproteobacteria bacterium]|nr:putative metal-binding motif-containing protein [Deltaproteobacteria bacterium]